MINRRKIVWVELCLTVALILPAQASGMSPQGELPLVGDPSFDPNSLSPEMREWYNRLLESMADSQNTVNTRSRSNNLYELGRYVNDYTTALLLALRATGDLQFLDRAAEIWDGAKLDLADAWCDGTTDGYLNWLWLNDTSTSLYCKDTHEMDDSMTHGIVAELAYALHLNRDLDPIYGQKADYWTNHLKNQFLQKWYERDGDALTSWQSGGLYRRLTHPRANQLRIAYYLYKLTNDPFYLDRANEIAFDLSSKVEINPTTPTAYQWKHQVSGSEQGYQRINYAHYYMNVLLQMHLEGFNVYASDTEMQKYMSTFRDVVFTKFGSPWTSMAYRVDGSESTGTNMYGLTGLARWDTTNTILQIAEAKYDSGSGGLTIAGGALMALSQRTTEADTPAPPTGLRTTFTQ